MYFHRVELAWPGRSRALRRSRVVVVGAGAIGSVLAMRLARAGVGELVLVDGDVVEPHNLERVDCYTEEDVGRPKVEALARCIRRLRRGEKTWVHAIPSYLDAGFYERWYPQYEWAFRKADLYILGVDNDVVRREVGELSAYWNKPLLDVSFGVGVGRVLYYPEPRRGPCRLCFFSKADEEAMYEILGYNLQATCPACGRRFKVENWRWDPKVGGRPARAVREGEKVVAVEVECPLCGHIFAARTPDAPAPSLSEWVHVTTSMAFYVAVRHLLGRRPQWNAMYIYFEPDIKITTFKIAPQPEHHRRHVPTAGPRNG
jgi:molybdopterin/thiamine biosynthesis adenylyltransferase